VNYFLALKKQQQLMFPEDFISLANVYEKSNGDSVQLVKFRRDNRLYLLKTTRPWSKKEMVSILKLEDNNGS
jgi:hypothetical protein